MARKKKVRTLKKGFKWYPLKKETVIGDTKHPIGYKIALTEEGYKFYKQKNIV
jgi:hypothetical protein